MTICHICKQEYLPHNDRECPVCKLDKDWEEYTKNQELRLKQTKGRPPF